jgi:hypothetical protein
MTPDLDTLEYTAKQVADCNAMVPRLRAKVRVEAQDMLSLIAALREAEGALEKIAQSAPEAEAVSGCADECECAECEIWWGIAIQRKIVARAALTRIRAVMKGN